MNYLAFHPALDVLHTEFRFLRLREIIDPSAPWHYDQLRIADFYLVFFGRLQSVRLKPGHRKIKAVSKSDSSQMYENYPGDRTIFNRMGEIQRAAFGTLIAKNFFDRDSYGAGYVAAKDGYEPERLFARIRAVNELQKARLDSIGALVDGYPLLGSNGLKARTGLLEYRYDAI